jgi:hypothetical protein
MIPKRTTRRMGLYVVDTPRPRRWGVTLILKRRRVFDWHVLSSRAGEIGLLQSALSRLGPKRGRSFSMLGVLRCHNQPAPGFSVVRLGARK